MSPLPFTFVYLLCDFFTIPLKQLFLLLRKNSPIYSHFSAYLAEHKDTDASSQSSTPGSAKKYLATPKTPGKSKLSPLSCISHLLPQCRAQTFQEAIKPARSKLFRQNTVQELPGISVTPVPGEDKRTPLTASKPYLLLNSTKCTAASPLSPLKVDNVVRVVSASDSAAAEKCYIEEAKMINATKGKKLILCACGKPCESKSDTTYLACCPECKGENQGKVKFAGYLYEHDINEKLFQRYWYALVGPYLHRTCFFVFRFRGWAL